MIVEIKAKFACDECGAEFTVRIDPGYEPPDGWAMLEVAEDQIRGGLWYEEPGEKGDRANGSGSVDGSNHYCRRCSKERDDANETR